ncbi:hypothetical protein MX569_14485, partial [Anoxybacillus kestanbolensis]|uniref:hypothetical protein n=1 Tax=Anoxybacillus kestanbolensis TaxID=227476 RepID=UPI00208DB8B7
AHSITFDYKLLQPSIDYIQKIYKYVSKSYIYYYSLEKCSELVFTESGHSCFISISMKNGAYLGYSGGKDSTLCKLLAEKNNENLEYYHMSFDSDKSNKDYHLEKRVLNQRINESLTFEGHEMKSNLFVSHQADDIHVVFAAPYFNVNERSNKRLLVGIPWDNINDVIIQLPNNTDKVGDFVPTETYTSLKIFEQYMRAMGLVNFEIVSPIASLHSYGVYKILSELRSVNFVKSLESCWYSWLYKEKFCGTCPKCQRVMRIFKEVFNEQISAEVPILEVDATAQLFGSIATEILLNNYENISSSLLLSKASRELSKEYIDVLKSIWKFEEQEITELVSTYSNKLTLDKIKNLIKGINGDIDYDKLSDLKIHSESVPYLPFENFCEWNRSNMILNCYSHVAFVNYESPYKESTIIPLSNRDTNKKEILYLPDIDIYLPVKNSLSNVISTSIEHLY